jgi:lysophospholipase L1-like esterase
MRRAMMAVENIIPNYPDKILTVRPGNLMFLLPLYDKAVGNATELSGNNLIAPYTATGITYGVPGIGDGKTAIYVDTTGAVGIYSAALNALWNGTEFTVLIWAAIPASTWIDGTNRYLWCIGSAATDMVYFERKTTNNQIGFSYIAGSNRAYLDFAPTGAPTTYQNWVMTVSKTNNRLRVFQNGAQYSTDVATPGTWAGAPLAAAQTAIGARRTAGAMLPFIGSLAYAVGWNIELTPAEVATLASPFDVIGTLFIGDSKTSLSVMREPLLNNLSSITGRRWVERPARIGVSGITTDLMAAQVDADIAAMAGITEPRDIIINLGANDMGTDLPKADWKADTEYIILAYHAAFPSANIRLTKVWRATASYPAVKTRMDQAIDELYATYNWLATGINEADFIPGSDNGATNTTDGVHPSGAGGLLAAEAWKTAMGY